jgi:MSHA biogenesis protein MshJ
VDKLNAWIEKIDALTIRERAMIMLAILAVLIFTWDKLFMMPLDAKRKSMNAEFEIKRAELAALSIQVQQAIMAQAVDPNAASRDKLAQLRIELAGIESRVRDTTVDMIEPTRMPEVLRSVINQINNLTLTNLKGLGSSPLVAVTEAKPSPETEAGTEADNQYGSAAFKHGLQIRLRGDYLTTLEYLRRMEKLQWRVFWDSLEFRVGEYPDAESVLTIYTLSLTRDWIRA